MVGAKKKKNSGYILILFCLDGAFDFFFTHGIYHLVSTHPV